MTVMTKKSNIPTSSDFERKIRCGFCQLDWPQSKVRTLMTAKILIDTYNNLNLMGLNTSGLYQPKLNVDSFDYF